VTTDEPLRVNKRAIERTVKGETMRNFSIVQPSLEKIRYQCLSCKRHTNHEEIFVYRLDIPPDPDNFIDEANEIFYKTIKCCGCDDTGFAKITNTYEINYSEDIPEYEREPKVTAILYPSRREIRPSVRGAFVLPKNIKTIYHEILATHAIKAYTLTAIGIRTIIQAVCKEVGAKGKNLELKIDSLFNEKKVLTEEGKEALHRMRFLGNKAAHETETPTGAHLEAALDVLNHLLTAVYILPVELKLKMESLPPHPKSPEETTKSDYDLDV
jgi:hypothetical protein